MVTSRFQAEFGLPLTTNLISPLAECIDQLIISNAIMPPEIHWDGVDHEGEEGFQLRKYLERHKRYHADAEINRLWRDITEYLGEDPTLHEGDEPGGFVFIDGFCPNSDDDLVKSKFAVAVNSLKRPL